MNNKLFLGRGKSAQAMVEFAIALPVLLLLLYGILEAGRLLFVYSTVVTASRQAARYGSATGEGTNGILRYNDCEGIRAAANAVGYLGEFDTISLAYDQGVNNANPPQPIGRTPYCTGSTGELTTATLEGNRTRLVVSVTEKFTPLVRLVPFFERDIVAESARTILYSVPIVVEQDEEEWFKTPTVLTITADTPDPSEIFQSVNVTVTLTGGSPTGSVTIGGADENCVIPDISGGTGSCNIRFFTAGIKVITAFYSGDDDHLASSDTEDHTVTIFNTVTTILSDLPDPSVRDEPFVVVVQVTGGTTPPTGTVNVDGGGNVRCTFTLSNGAGSCPLSFNTLGLKTLTATYNGSGTHLPSSATETHTVLEGTPTPTSSPTATLPPTATLIPTATLTPTATFTPTPIPSPVSSCNLVDDVGGISRSGNVMSITINNPYPFTIVMQDLTVTWNDDKGHQTGSDKTLRLQRVDVGASNIWFGNVGNRSTFTIPTTAILPPGTTTISFYFHQSYDNLDGTERVLINLLTPGCEGNPIDTN